MGRPGGALHRLRGGEPDDYADLPEGLDALIRFWIVFASVVLAASLAIHLSTLFGLNPMEAVPGVMLIHGLIFPPFIAALYYLKVEGYAAREDQPEFFKFAPGWLRTMAAIFFIYAVGNFLVMIAALNEPRGPGERYDKSVLSSQSPESRKLTAERNRRQAPLLARGFSGHWMLFSSAALMVLVAADRRRRESE